MERLDEAFIKYQTENKFRANFEGASAKEQSLPHAWSDTVQFFIMHKIKSEDWHDLYPAMLEFLRTFIASSEANFRELPEWETLSAKLAKRFQELAKSGRYNTETWFETGGR